VYGRPASAWAASFLGFNNLINGTVAAREPLWVNTAIGGFQAGGPPDHSIAVGSQVTLLIRPTGSRLAANIHPTDSKALNQVNGQVEDVLFQGDKFRIGLRCSPTITLQFYLAEPLKPGQNVTLTVEPGSIVCLE
jgi:ABC-type Fe3+/spermidine/putrescine transport system ATPase subunit